MENPDSEEKEKLIEDLSAMTVKTYKELETAKQMINEKELQLMELATVSNQKITEAAKANHQLKNKVDYLQEITNALNEKNDELERKNIELETQKAHYNQLTKKLKKDLEKVAEREKNLEIHRNKLAFEVEKKTKELIKSEKMASVGQLSSRLVHDLRNPLTVIKSGVELLKMGNKHMDKKTSDKFQRIERALKKISYQIEDVLDFVRQSELSLRRLPIEEIVESSLSNIEIPKDVKIKKEFRKSIVNCDSRKLEAVFTNILTNAIQAMGDKGEIKIKVYDDGESGIVKITDSGPGIRKTVIDKIFEPLYTTKETGTGLGLSICKTIVEQHGGTIEVTSPPTTFTIILPKNIRNYNRAT